MGQKFEIWVPKTQDVPLYPEELTQIIYTNRNFSPINNLEYEDPNINIAAQKISEAIKKNKKIALYADYDVDGIMSCISWIWFLNAINYKNFVYYIPNRLYEGYGVNINAIKKLIFEHNVNIIITMDTGITAAKEALFCTQNQVDFICTDHHTIQQDSLPTPPSIVINPKLNSNPLYHHLCGCGITFVILRKLRTFFTIPDDIWIDLLSLVGLATICDIVPINGVNHKLVKLALEALQKTQRPIIKKLWTQCGLSLNDIDTKDIGFVIGPHINAVGRIEDASYVIEAFTNQNTDEFIKKMKEYNIQRKNIQSLIQKDAEQQALHYTNDPILFLGGNWHIGVIGIVSAKIAEQFGKPTWLFSRENSSLYKGSARSIPGFNIMDAMEYIGKELFVNYGGHTLAAGFSFKKENEHLIREKLIEYAQIIKQQNPQIWQSKIYYDCKIPLSLIEPNLSIMIEKLKPFGHGFEEPVFEIQGQIYKIIFYKDKISQTLKHTGIFIKRPNLSSIKIMFFNQVIDTIQTSQNAKFLVKIEKNMFNNLINTTLVGIDLEIL